MSQVDGDVRRLSLFSRPSVERSFRSLSLYRERGTGSREQPAERTCPWHKVPVASSLSVLMVMSPLDRSGRRQVVAVSQDVTTDHQRDGHFHVKFLDRRPRLDTIQQTRLRDSLRSWLTKGEGYPTSVRFKDSIVDQRPQRPRLLDRAS